MLSTKVLIELAVLTIFCVKYSVSIKCYFCNDKKSCGEPQKYECTQTLANVTRNYLATYHKYVPITTSSTFDCFSEHHKSINGEFYYKGCIYHHISGCNLLIRDFYTQGIHERSCDQCYDKDYCSPVKRFERKIKAVPPPPVTMLLATHDSSNIFASMFGESAKSLNSIETVKEQLKKPKKKKSKKKKSIKPKSKKKPEETTIERNFLKQNEL